MKLRLFLLATTFALVLSACSSGPSDEDIEATVSARLTEEAPTEALPTATSEPEPEQPASGDEPEMVPPPAAAGDPTLTTLVNLRVRSGPGTNYHIIGSMPAGTAVRILGKSPDGFWWKVECPAGAGGECWTSAATQFGTATNVDGVQVAAVPPAPPPPTSTTAAVAQATHTPTATATQDGQHTATATPTATQEGQATATYTYTPTPSPTTDSPTETASATPTATDAAQEAPFDNDSLQNPARSEFLSITGTRNFSHSDAVSYEGGDQDDWVEFEFPNNSNSSQRVWITLDCTITGDPGAQLRATIYEDGNSTNDIVICGEGEVQKTVDNTKVQQVRIHWGIPKPGVYATYTITIVGFK